MKKHSVLNDHVKRGNTFYPPLLANKGINVEQAEWRRRIVPELIWLVPLFNKYGVEKAKSLAYALCRAVGEESGWSFIGTISCFRKLKPVQKSAIRKRMQAAGILTDLCDALEPILRMYPKCPLRFLMGDNKLTVNKQNAMKYIAPLLEEFLFRGEILPTLIQGIYYDINLKMGRMHFNKGLSPHNTSKLSDYPDTDESRQVASFIRCFISQIGMLKKDLWWPEYFWQQGNNLGSCQFSQDDEITPGLISRPFILYHAECFEKYSEETGELWFNVMTHYKFNIYNAFRDEILLGLASRIYRLTIQIVSYIPNWVEDIGQVYVRMAVESYIYWKWLKTCGSDDDFKKYYEHGLGQQKLYMEHLNTYLTSNGMSMHEAEEQNTGLNFIRRHKLSSFIPVNVGNPLDKNLRILAEEADLKELYCLVFSPASSIVHGMYDSLEKYYLRQCRNPFHCFHRVPFYWSKNSVSEYGLAQTLTITDWVFAEMLEDVKLPAPEVLPGERFYNLLHDEQELTSFMNNPDIVEEAKVFEEFIYHKMKEDDDAKKSKKGKQ